MVLLFSLISLRLGVSAVNIFFLDENKFTLRWDQSNRTISPARRHNSLFLRQQYLPH